MKDKRVIIYRKKEFYSYFENGKEIRTKYKTYDSFLWHLIHEVKKRNEKLELIKYDAFKHSTHTYMFEDVLYIFKDKLYARNS